MPNEQKLRVLTTFPQEMLHRACEEVPDLEVRQIPEQGDIDADIRAQVLLIPPWDTGNLAAVLEHGIEWVHTIGTGVDRLPLDLLTKVKLSCARGASSIPIAEWVLASMLAFEKQLPESWLKEVPENWSAMQLGTLHGKTLGLVGLGGIGSATAQLAQAFGMRVIALRRSDTASPVSGIEQTKDIKHLLSQSQHIVLALPLTASSRHILNDQTLAYIPPGAGVHIINPSRGGLIDQDALRTALDDDRIARASLDTVEPEPLPEGHWLLSHDKIKVTPHVSWSMPTAFDLLLDSFIENLRRFKAGQPLHGLVDISHGY